MGVTWPPEVNEKSRLDRVFHVTHLADAIRIIEDGKIKASLVYDEASRLHNTRTSVVWVSPNVWNTSNGFIYGSVSFAFNWSEVVGDRSFYWIENTRTRRLWPTYRLLLTDGSAPAPDLLSYDAAAEKGPIRSHNGSWYWKENGHVAEFMLASDIDLSNCVAIEAVQHRHCLRGLSCEELGSRERDTAAKLLARLLGVGFKKYLRDPLERIADPGINQLVWSLASPHQPEWFTGPIDATDEAVSLVRGALLLYGAGDAKSVKESLSLLKSNKVFLDVLKILEMQYFERDFLD